MDATLRPRKWEDLLGEVHTENKAKDRTLGHPEMQETRRENRQEEVRVISIKRPRTERTSRRLVRQAGAPQAADPQIPESPQNEVAPGGVELRVCGSDLSWCSFTWNTFLCHRLSAPRTSYHRTLPCSPSDPSQVLLANFDCPYHTRARCHDQ